MNPLFEHCRRNTSGTHAHCKIQLHVKNFPLIKIVLIHLRTFKPDIFNTKGPDLGSILEREQKQTPREHEKKKTSNGLSIKFPCLKEGKLIACKFIIQLRHFQWDLCHPAVDTTGRAVITQAPLLHSRKALPPLCGGRRGLWVVRLLLGCMKTSLVVLSQHVLVLPCLIPMVLSPKPCPVVSHSCGSMWMDYPIQSFMKANPLVGRIHSFPWKKVIGSSNE